jgi:tetratricopeptide (TPR) repeat protein
VRTLRLVQEATGAEGVHRVEVTLEGEGAPRRAVAQVKLALEAAELDRLRWYLEDYPAYPINPAPRIAAEVEDRLAGLGVELFRAVFHASDDTRDLWATVRDHLADTRVEVVTDVAGATAIPWELLRDPTTNVPLALRARAFVRAYQQAAQRPAVPAAGVERLRVLLVICRPDAEQDVPFRSVASHLVRLSPQARAAFQLDVLRPPTFARLGQVLRGASERGEPYHVVHFDGHGTWADLASQPSGGDVPGWLRSQRFAGRAGAHGWLLFEQPGAPGNVEYVEGPALGGLLAETGVPVLVLNACRSAHAALATTPEQASQASGGDVHARVRAYGSLAQEVMDAGVAGVVAMRYNVYVVTAAQFVGELYGALLAGRRLGEAVTRARKHLADQPVREVGLRPVRVQDWIVPVVYEATALPVVAPKATGAQVEITLDPVAAARERGTLESGLADAPDVGFFGRDETLLALDRAFDDPDQHVVLLHAWAGQGKTTTAAEFARWYHQTGGAQAVLFTSFERHTPLARVLDQVGATFADTLELEAAGVAWLTLDDQARRRVALQVLAQVPVLWVWDNVEPVTGFPAGSPSAWTNEEQQELAGFLRALRETQAKVLLTSRRDERAWVGELPRRIPLRGMPMAERVQLARALAVRHGHTLDEVADWQPLLEFTQGNPLTVTVLVGQALREGLRTREQVEAFVERLRAGQAAIADEQAQGRAASLGASLSYGFTHAFTTPERARLALLHLFQGFVQVDALRMLGDPKMVDAPVPELTGMDRAAGVALLDRAVEVGLLTRHGGGYYGVHPALPWYFQRLFAEVYGPPEGPAGRRALRAWTVAAAGLGNHYMNEYIRGRTGVVAVLAGEEANLLAARQVAHAHAWWHEVVAAMQGLRVLYEQASRWVEWARLVEELIPDLTDPTGGGPHPGLEEEWRVLTGYRVSLAKQARDMAGATRQQQALVAFTRERAAAALGQAPETLDPGQRDGIRWLATSLEQLGDLLVEQGDSTSAGHLEEAAALCQRVGDRQIEALALHSLGNAYLTVPALWDLDRAERYYQDSLGLFDQQDRPNRAACHAQLGHVAYLRFWAARTAGASEQVQRGHLQAAADHSQQALALTPASAIDHVATVHNSLGLIYDHAGRLEAALHHFQEAIRHRERARNRHGAGQVRENLARALAGRGRLGEARTWAQAALRDYESYGEHARADIDKMRQLLDQIDQIFQTIRSGR